MRTFDVVIEQQNGHYRASVLSLPQIAVEAASRDEALTQVRRAAEDYFAKVEVATIQVATAEQDLRPGSPQSVLRAAATTRIDVNDELYQQYVADMDAEQQRQREEAELEAYIAAQEYPIAERWALEMGIEREDPNDPLYQAYRAELAAEKKRQYEEAEREAEADRAAELVQDAR